jgi:hypothetical protein
LLRSCSHISIFNISGRDDTESQFLPSFRVSDTICSFSLFELTKGVSQGIY